MRDQVAPGRIAHYGVAEQAALGIDLIGADVEIEARYLVPRGSSLLAVEEVDRPGNRIATTPRSAHGRGARRAIG